MNNSGGGEKDVKSAQLLEELKMEISADSQQGPFLNGLLCLKKPEEDRVPGRFCQEST